MLNKLEIKIMNIKYRKRASIRSHNATIEQENIVKHLFFNSSVNSISSISEKSKIDEYLVNEIISRFLNMSPIELNLESNIPKADTSESEMIERSTDREIIIMFNTPTKTNTDFSNRLKTIKLFTT